MTEPHDQPDVEEASAPAVHSVGLLRRWQDSEPVRLYLYGVLGAVLPLLLEYGLMTGSTAALWSAAAAAVLGVPAVEGLRSQVFSPRSTVQSVVAAHRNGVTEGRKALATDVVDGLARWAA